MGSKRIIYLKTIVFFACLIPLILLIWNAFYDKLGANPIEVITHNTGEWTLRFLLITLAVTPLKRLFNLSWLLRLRRMLGLYAFFYVLLHFTTYIWLDQFFLWEEILFDIYDRPFITVGMAAFLLLIPLAFTSTNRAMRFLGSKWQRLHRLVYVIAILGVLHFIWLVKLDLREPLIYAGILILLLAYRGYHWFNKRHHRKLASTAH